jgi:hypothetical protein
MAAEELILQDHSGAIMPNMEEMMVSQELLSYLDSTNKILGTDKDPRFSEFKAFQDSIDAASIIKIDLSDISQGKFNDLDLTGVDSEIKDVDDTYLYGIEFADDDNKTMEVLAAMTFLVPESTGEILDKEFMPFKKSGWVLPWMVR